MTRLTIKIALSTLFTFVMFWLTSGLACDRAKAGFIATAPTPELPRVLLNTDYAPPSGKVIPVVDDLIANRMNRG